MKGQVNRRRGALDGGFLCRAAIFRKCQLRKILSLKNAHKPIRRRVSSVVEHSSANPKVPSLILGPVSYRGHGL